MTYRQLTRKLRRLGCQFHRQGKGDHEIWANDATLSTAPIPNWRGKDLKPGTIGSTLLQLGISKIVHESTPERLIFALTYI